MPTYIPLNALPFQFQDSVTSRNSSGGSIEFYLFGTNTPTNLFSDSAGTSIGTSVTLNAGGFPESGGNVVTLFRDEAVAYKLILKNAAGATISTSSIPVALINRAPYFGITDEEAAAGVTILDFGLETGNVSRYGGRADGTLGSNRAAFIAAVASTPVGGRIVVPDGSADPFLIDTSGGESSAIVINKRLTVVIDGVVKASFGAVQANPPTIFLVSGDNVTFTGTGKLMGHGAVNQVNAGTEATFPSLVKVTGDNFTMDGLTVDTPYKIGVFLHGCESAKISNCNFTGGPTGYEDTAYFGIRVYQGVRHIISNNQFYPDAAGGMYVQCIFSNSGSFLLVEGNVARHPYEKLAYVNGDHNTISGNIVVGNTGYIPGTNQKGTIGPPIRHDGVFGVVTDNQIYSAGGGISAIGGGGLDISDNTMHLVGQSGIAVFAGAVAFDYLSIRNNIMVGGAIEGVIINSGINVDAPTGSNFYLDISHNQVVGFAPTDGILNVAEWNDLTVIPYYAVVKPTVANSRVYTTIGGGTTGASEPTWPTTPNDTVVDGTVTWTCVAIDSTTSAGIKVDAPGGGLLNERCIISYNNIAGGAQACRIGIWTDYLSGSLVSHNRMRCSVYGIQEDNGTSNRYLYNQLDSGVGAAVAIQGLGATSYGEGNIYNTALPLIANVTLPGGSVNTVTIATSVLLAAANAKVIVTPTNAAAGALVKDHGGVFATVVAPNVILTSGDAANFAGTETFNVHVIQ